MLNNLLLIIDALYKAIGITVALTIHEYVKAVTSARLGDPLPKSRGRLTLNPLKHLEPIGFVCMFAYGFGWGRPVETSATYYEDRRKGTFITYTTPSVVNLVVSIMFLCLYNILIIYMRTITSGSNAFFYTFYGFLSIVRYISVYNFMAALFNIIPVYPMDGARIMSLFLKPELNIRISAYEKLFQVGLILLMFTGILSLIFSPVTGFFFSLFFK